MKELRPIRFMCHIYDPEEGEKFIAFFFTYETNYEEVANALLNKFDSVISEIKYQNGHKFFRVMINQEDQVFDKLYHLRLDFERVLFDQLHAVRSEFKDIIKTWRNQEEEINVLKAGSKRMGCIGTFVGYAYRASCRYGERRRQHYYD